VRSGIPYNKSMKKFLAFLLFFASQTLSASVFSEIKFGKCPQKRVKDISEDLLDSFKKKKSMGDLKKILLSKKIEEKYFITSYQIDYEPVTNKLLMSFECPDLIGNIVLYDKAGKKKYHMVLGRDGKTYDPNYEVLLRAESKIKGKLTSVSFEDNVVTQKRLGQMSDYLKFLEKQKGIDFNELILNKENQLVGIFSRNQSTTSVFFGKHSWSEKTQRLKKSLDYFMDKKKQPSLIKFVDDKKIVVKFSRPL